MAPIYGPDLWAQNTGHVSVPTGMGSPYIVPPTLCSIEGGMGLCLVIKEPAVFKAVYSGYCSFISINVL